MACGIPRASIKRRRLTMGAAALGGEGDAASVGRGHLLGNGGFGGVRLVHVQFRQADFAALLEEFDAQPVGGNGFMRSTSGSLAYMAFCASLTPAVAAPREPQWMGIHLPPLLASMTRRL